MKEAFRKLWANRTARILLVAFVALLLLAVCWIVFGNKEAQATDGGYVPTDREARLAALLSEVEDAGNVNVYITEEDGSAVGAIVMFDGTDGILVRLRLTQIAARALDIAENRVLICPTNDRK